MPGTDADSQMRLLAGRYRLLRELGRGGMGVVWVAEDLLVGRQVAVKELRAPHGLPGDQREVHARRALREARSVGRVRHPGVVELYDVLPATAGDDAIYLIMELINGLSLDKVVRRGGPLRDVAVAAYARQLLTVLEVAHGLGIVHRDIKPSNILVAEGGRVKLADFGIAYTLGETRLTETGAAGTIAYMAPELFERKPVITPAVDLWSLGATLYYAAVARGPFDRNRMDATLRAILMDDIPALACSPGLAAAVAGMLVRDPARRVTAGQAQALLDPAKGPGSSPGNGTGQARQDTVTSTWGDGAGTGATGQEPEFVWIGRGRDIYTVYFPVKLVFSPKARRAIAENRSRRTFVYSWGIRYVNGDKEFTARWDEISAVFRFGCLTRGVAGAQDVFCQFTVELTDGRKQKIFGFLDPRLALASEEVPLDAAAGATTEVTIEQLGRLLEQRVKQVRLPEALDRFKAGQPVPFGPLTVSAAGISHGWKTLSWREIKGVRNENEWVSITKKGREQAPWRPVQVSRVPNYPVFIEVVGAGLDPDFPVNACFLPPP